MKAYPHPETGNPVLEADSGETDEGSYHGFAILSEYDKHYIAFGNYFEGEIPSNWVHTPLQIIVQA